MKFLAKCGWTALLIVVQPIKLIVSLAVVIWIVSRDCGREFYGDLKNVWRA